METQEGAGRESRWDIGCYARAVAVLQRPAPVGPTETERLAQLVGQLNDLASCSWYLLGGMLARLQENQRWREVYSGEWLEFVEQRLGMQIRRSQYLTQLYGRGRELGLSLAQVERLGWTKALALVSVATRETLGEWMEAAETSTRNAFRETVRQARQERRARPAPPTDVTPGPPVDPDEERERFTVWMSADARRNVEAAIANVQTQFGPRSAGSALDLLIMDAVANQLPDRRWALDWVVKNIERVYQVQLTVVPVTPGGERVEGP